MSHTVNNELAIRFFSVEWEEISAKHFKTFLTLTIVIPLWFNEKVYGIFVSNDKAA